MVKRFRSFVLLRVLVPSHRMLSGAFFDKSYLLQSKGGKVTIGKGTSIAAE